MSKMDQLTIKDITISYHQSGLNGAQAVLKALMDYAVISDIPELITMTEAWKGGIGGETCSAFAAGTLAIRSLGNNYETELPAFKEWFLQKYGSIDCPTITDMVGGRPSPQQKVYCDVIAGETANYIFQLYKTKK